MKFGLIHSSFLLVFRPTALKRVAGEYVEHLNRPETIAEKRKKENEGPPYHERCIDRLRRGLALSFLLVAAAFVVAAITGRVVASLYGPVPKILLEFLQYAGIGILLWATLGKQGWSIQTMNGTTVPEVLDEFVYRVLYVFGSFVLAFAVTAQLAS